MSTTPRTLLKESEASAITGFSTPTLRKRRWQGLPPRYLKVGSKVFYDRQDLEDYLDSCVRTSTTDSSDEEDKPCVST